MATVRITNELKEKITNTISNHYDVSLAADDLSGILKAAKPYVEARVKQDHALAEELIIKGTAALRGVCLSLGCPESEIDSIAGRAAVRLTSESYGYDDYSLMHMCADGTATKVGSVRVDYDDIIGARSLRYPGWDARDNKVFIPEVTTGVEDILEARKAVKMERTKVLHDVKALLDSCTTLKQLFKRWPAARNYVPQAYVDKMNEASESRASRELPEVEVDVNELTTKLTVAAVTAQLGGR